MNTYLKVYRWALGMKLHMGIYTLSLLVCKMIWNWTQGVLSVQSLDILTIWGACLLFAVLETLILPAGKDASLPRTAAWAAAGNLIFCSGALIAGWFRGIPGWGAALLVFFLEFGLAAMWFEDNVAMRADSAQLNQQLRAFQRRPKEQAPRP